MVFHRMLMQVIWVGVILSAIMAATATTFPLALPNCPDSCGNVTIPYPFGTTEGCYRKESSRDFFINCRNSYGQAQPMTGNLGVTNISIEGEIDILMYNAIDCYNQSGTPLEINTRPWLQVPSFTLSVTRNKFVAVGCDTYAYLNGNLNDQPFSIGCLSRCMNISNVIDGTCSGIGCCQMDIPQDLTDISFRAYSFKNHTQVWKFNPCSFAFIIKEDKFIFSSDYLTSLRNNKTLPMVLDWAIGNETCQVARYTENYICGGNSTCIDLKNRSGYRCQCRDGYRGNPYLKDGCQGIQYTWAALDFNISSAGIGISFITMLVGSTWLYLIVNKRKLIRLKEKFFKQNGGLILEQLRRQEGSTETTKIFTEEELQKATNNYNESRIIGQGGFGTVYKGVLPNTRVVAIKKSKTIDQSQIQQFINEVFVLSQINHRNVVKLLGCCLETPVPLLVYEFITNDTLFKHLHHKSNTSVMPWQIRLKIAAETAEALAYLHSEASTPIIHRDVKSTNILLDDKYTAKVSDFGASKLVPLDQTQLATMVQGTLGYLDPEYLLTSQLTEKSDVYSFGVVLVELLTGEEALSFSRSEQERSVAMHFLCSLKEERLFDVLDDHVVEEGNKEQLKEVAELAKSCLRVKGEERPTMKDVAMELAGIRKMETHPWVDFGETLEETEHLLRETSGEHSSSSKTTGYDSMNNHVILALGMGDKCGIKIKISALDAHFTFIN
ncbi:wall-associated receptor kinase 2 [Quercus suber]|uniref:wall-associated receptor kinase 2 n=1 Tax=Quercus suber TaxID=58331 RepID=UPI0032DF9937